jgi:hypothetical protein
VLGPILFILFISDINKFLPEGVELEKYADDILAYLIYSKGSDPGNLPQLIADAVERWCTVNRMRLNPGKCKAMVLITIL